MIAVPPGRLTAQAQIEFFSRVAAALPDTPVMLQNVPAPVGAGLDPSVLLEILNAVPAIRYIKEETLPSGQRLSILYRAVHRKRCWACSVARAAATSRTNCDAAHVERCRQSNWHRFTLRCSRRMAQGKANR